MVVGQDVLSDLGIALSREWVLGNGLGGSASGTVSGMPTRSVHAHLVAAGPSGRTHCLLLRLEERLLIAGGAFELANDPYSGNPHHPAGWRLLEDFRSDPHPTWRFVAGDVVLEKSLFLIYGHNAAVVSYRHQSGPAARLSVSPLVVARRPTAIQREFPDPRGALQGVPGRVRIEMTAGGPALTVWHNGVFMPARAWRRQLHYAHDARAGRETGEDAFVPGYVEAPLPPGGSLHLVASAEDQLLRVLAQEDRLGSPPPRTLAECVAALEADERSRAGAWRRAALVGGSITSSQASAARSKASAPRAGAPDARDPPPSTDGPALMFADEDPVADRQAPFDERDPWVAPLAETLRMALVRRGSRLTLLSSLPGAEERGSDCLRSVAGLVALRGFEAAREVLRGYVEYLDEGLAPESFDPDDGTPRYGDPEPALWLAIAGELYARRSQDHEFARNVLYPALEGMTRAYRSGTRHGIRIDSDGLLLCGEGEHAEKRADLNALWYHASVAVAQLARSSGRKETGAFHLAWAHEHQRRFNEVLWDDERGCLHATVGAPPGSTLLAPSQLLAAGLPPPLLPLERAARLLETVERELFTPFGLHERAGDEAVSTVWLGAFFSAYLRAHRRDERARRQVHAWFAMLRSRLDEATCGMVPVGFEVGPGTPPAPRRDATTGKRRRSPRSQAPGGTEVGRQAGDPASILASAELLRVWIEELESPIETRLDPS
jgi:glycogen debranching enzyme